MAGVSEIDHLSTYVATFLLLSSTLTPMLRASKQTQGYPGMLTLAWQSILIGFIVAGLTHVAAAIVVMAFEDHHTMAATLVRSVLITILVAPGIFYLLWQERTGRKAPDIIKPRI